MFAMFVCLFLCLSLGVALGGTAAGALGAVFGATIGAVCGMLWWSAWDTTRKIPVDATLGCEQLDVMCLAKGRPATATFVRNARNGRWLDVERCTLCTPADDVRCAKTCLHLMRSLLPARRHPVQSQAGAGSGAA